MKKAIITGLVLLGFAAIAIITGSAIKASDGTNKVLVNHTTANGTKTIELAIDENALESHLSHGDTVVSDGTIGDDTGQ